MAPLICFWMALVKLETSTSLHTCAQCYRVGEPLILHIFIRIVSRLLEKCHNTISIADGWFNFQAVKEMKAYIICPFVWWCLVGNVPFFFIVHVCNVWICFVIIVMFNMVSPYFNLTQRLNWMFHDVWLYITTWGMSWKYAKCHPLHMELSFDWIMKTDLFWA